MVHITRGIITLYMDIITHTTIIPIITLGMRLGAFVQQAPLYRATHKDQ